MKFWHQFVQRFQRKMRKTSENRPSLRLTLLSTIFLSQLLIRKCQFITSNGIESHETTYGSIRETFTVTSLWAQGTKLQTRKLNNKHLLHLLLYLSADIEPNPGPSPCQYCFKTVRCNQKRLRCTSCMNICHASCTTVNRKPLPSREETPWICSKCTHSELPFHNISTDQNPPVEVEPTADWKVTSEHIKALRDNRNHTSIATINTQSLLSSLTEFKQMIEDYNFDIVCVTETWLQNKTQEKYVQIPDYVFKGNHRGSKGGGVGIYLKESITFKERTDIPKIDPSIEQFWVEVNGKNKNSHYLVGCIYQPSSKEGEKREWCDKFEHLLSQVYAKWHGPIVICGDFNIDLLTKSVSQETYMNILNTFDLSQHVTKPTRKDKTLIDHISTNLPEKIIHQNVIKTDEISDHDLGYVIINIRKQRFEPRYKVIRDEKRFSLNDYITDFSQLPFNIVYAVDDPNDKVSMLNHLITECLSRHAPLKRTRFTRPPAPWMQDPIINNSKNALEEIRKTKSRDNSEYVKLRNNHKKLIRKVKSKFILKSLSSSNPKEVWKTIHRILKPPTARIKFDPDKLNDHYTTLASRLCEKENVPLNPKQLISALPLDTEQLLQMHETTYEEVNKIIRNLRSDCSSGHDNIPVKFLKPVHDYITSPLVHIINSCITTRSFPDLWKLARVCPIPKVANPTVAKDFRPVSILPILSKIFERVILNQILTFVESKVYNTTQSGFRKGHSTTTLLLKLRDDIVKAMNKNDITIAVMIDYSKAFDTIDHSILVRKLSRLGFGQSIISLIVSYLSNRKQYVQVDDRKSQTKNIFFGVPQGSILGPILFNIYVADLPNEIQTPSIQYADDTTLCKSCPKQNLFESIKAIELDLTSLCNWSRDNGLIFNSDKLQMMVIRKPRSLPSDRSYLLCSEGRSVRQELYVKILGIQMDENLSWLPQVNYATKSAYANLQTIKRFKRFTPYRVRKTLAESLVLSKLSYCNTVYAQIPQYLKKRIQRVQSCAAGYVLRRYCTLKDVTSLGWLLVEQRCELDLSIAGFKALNDEKWPDYLSMKKLKFKRTLRSIDNGIMIEPGENGTFNNQVSKVFNDLPKNIRNLDSISTFYSQTKKYFLDKSIAIALAREG